MWGSALETRYSSWGCTEAIELWATDLDTRPSDSCWGCTEVIGYVVQWPLNEASCCLSWWYWVRVNAGVFSCWLWVVTLESVMWAHAGALPFSGNFYERSQRGALGGNSWWRKGGGTGKEDKARKKETVKIYRGSRKQELEIVQKNYSFTAVFFNPFISIKNNLRTLTYSMANHQRSLVPLILSFIGAGGMNL